MKILNEILNQGLIIATLILALLILHGLVIYMTYSLSSDLIISTILIVAIVVLLIHIMYQYLNLSKKLMEISIVTTKYIKCISNTYWIEKVNVSSKDRIVHICHIIDFNDGKVILRKYFITK